MKLIYRTISHYPKSYKAIKIGLLIIILFLSQVFVSLFHGELVLEEQLKDEKAPFTQIYAFRNQELDFPGALTWFLNNNIDWEELGINDIITSQAIILSDDLFLENNENVITNDLAGKAIADLEGNEVAVSSAYAITNFGSIDAALGKTVTESVENTIGDKEVFFEMEIATVYQHSGLNRRFLNVLSDYDYDPTGGNSVYAETMYVADSEYRNYMKNVGGMFYISDEADQNYYMWGGPLRTRFVTKYTVLYDDYSIQNEIKLSSQLQIKSANYDAYYVIFQSLYNIINASALMSSSIGFMSSFQFVSLFVLLVSIIFYLIYLQGVATEKNETNMNKLGISKRKINTSKILHETLITILGFGIWLLINILFQVILKEKMLYVAEMFVFHRFIIMINVVVALIVGFIYMFSSLLLRLSPSLANLFNKVKSYTYQFDRKFYLKRLYQVTPTRFMMMVLVGLLCTSSFVILSRFEEEINTIYVNEQPITSDFSIRYTHEQGESLDISESVDMFKYFLTYTETHNNIAFTRHITQGETNSTNVTQANIYSDNAWEFMNFPRYPEMTDEQMAAIKLNSSIILSRRLQESFDIPSSVVKDFDKMYGEKHIDLETSEETWHDDLDLFVVGPRYFQAWGNIEKGAKMRVLGFDNIIDNNGYLYFHVNTPEFTDYSGTALPGEDNTPTTMHFIVNDDVKLSELKTLGENLLEKDQIMSYNIGINQDIFDYTGGDTKITTILLIATFSLYLVLLILLVAIKGINDRVLQQKNTQIYYRLGFNENIIGQNMRILNFITLMGGFVLGVLIVLFAMPLIRYGLYEVLSLFH